MCVCVYNIIEMLIWMKAKLLPKPCAYTKYVFVQNIYTARAQQTIALNGINYNLFHMCSVCVGNATNSAY